MENRSGLILILLLYLLVPINLYSKQYSCISNIYITGNQVTNSKIILRELTFEQGDSVETEHLDELLTNNRNNLLNLSLFNYVYVTKNTNPENAGNIDIHIRVEERWYVWPMVSFVIEDRNLSNWLKEGENENITVDAGLKAYNVWGMNHTLTASVKFGYQKGFRLDYDNITIDHTGRHRLGLGISYLISKTENFISLFNSAVYNNTDGVVMVKSLSGNIHYTFRPKVRKAHTFSIYCEKLQIADTILKLNPKYWGGNDSTRTGFGIKYKFTNDQRDNIQYPLKGYLLQGEATGYMTQEKSFCYSQLKTNIQGYLPISKRWNISANLTAGVSQKNKEAYIFDKAIGYENVYLRGYEYYVNDGQHYITLNQTLKYNLVPTKVKVINCLSFMPYFNKIHFTVYAKAFFDMGYAYHAYPHISNFLSNKFLCSGGFGLDLISYYDINFSLEYSFNQLKEHGFFFTIKSVLF